jgi:cytochrome c-type biogenesis protein CcsB
MRLHSVLLCLLAAALATLTPKALAQGAWQESFGAIPILQDGRVMPMDTFARNLAVEVTGRTKWREGKGPEGFVGREAIELLADLISQPELMWNKPLVRIDHRELKTQVGFDTEQRFFSAAAIMRTVSLHTIVAELRDRQSQDDKAKPTPVERAAAEAQSAAMLIASFQPSQDKHYAIVPQSGTDEFLTVGIAHGDPGTEDIHAALVAFVDTHKAGADPSAQVTALITTINAYAPLPEAAARSIKLEYFYNHHKPWLMAAIATVVALLLILARWILRLKLFTYLAAVAIVWAVAEQAIGFSLRVVILGRAPVTNTYEAILWLGVVALACGLVGQAINRKSWYLSAGLAASLIALLFAQLVPLSSQTNSLPAVLRSNYWLIIHVMTIVASYGAFLLSAVLGHAFLIRDVLLRRKPDPQARLIVQTYRVMQIGLILLTAGTILGGVWAAESWGRFWGWDPKETWSLISIVVYFVMLHARYCGWIKDFGLAVASIGGFLAIVWCFYGVNYVMATGLHSYGFGSGGEVWVAAWAVAEIVFISACFIMARTIGPTDRGGEPTAKQATPTPAV